MYSQKKVSMRYVRLLLLHFQNALEYRSRSFVWFLVSTFDACIFILFWRAAIPGDTMVGSWSLSAMASYYFILIILSAMLTSHTEEDVAKEDIQDGLLTQYLMKPFPYYWRKFLEEIPFRILQGVFGVLALLLFLIFFGQFFTVAKDPFVLILAVVVSIIAYLLFFTYKMVIGLTAFWLVDVGGFFQFKEMILLIFAGYVIPLDLLPQPLSAFSYILPFSYMMYFPVVAFQGKLTLFVIFEVIGMQLIWFSFFAIVYRFLWNKGIKQYSAIGQ